jgi:hypothetical protein
MAQSDVLRMNPLLVVPGLFNAAFMWDPTYQYVLRYTAWMDALVRVVYYAPIALQLAAGAYLARRVWRRTWSAADETTLLVLLVSAGLFTTVIPHPAVHYLLPTQVQATVLAVVLIGHAWHARHRWLRGIARVATVGTLVVYVAVSAVILVAYITTPRLPVTSDVGTVWLQANSASALNEALSFAKTDLDPSRPVFVVPYAPMFYFLSGLDHATRFVDLRPGSPGPAAEDEIIAGLEAEHVDVVLYFVGAQYDAIDSFQDAYPRVYRYVMTHYELDRSISTYFGPYIDIRRRHVAEH